MRCEAVGLDRAQRHPDPIVPGQQVILGGGLQPAEITAQNRLELALQLPGTDAAGAVVRHANLGPRQCPSFDNLGPKLAGTKAPPTAVVWAAAPVAAGLRTGSPACAG